MANTGYRKIHDPRLKRYIPSSWEHVEKYPLTRRTLATVTKPAPITVGINWYSSFSEPVKKGNKWYAGLDKNNLGTLEGGHCICIPQDPASDTYSWYVFYDQLSEGACVGFGSSRMMTLLNRKKYNARWLWDTAKATDEWTDTNPGDNEGTSVRAAMDILRTLGHVTWAKSQADDDWQERSTLAPAVPEGITANRWATTIEDMHSVLQNATYKSTGLTPFLNSWGKDYPHLVWVPDETWEVLMNEQGEFTMVTDR